MSLDTKILGCWTRTHAGKIRNGIAIDTFYPDGNKKSVITMFEGVTPKVLEYNTTWLILNNRLHETLTEIVSDPHNFLDTYQVGDEIVSKIKKLQSHKLVLFSTLAGEQFVYRRSA